MRSASFLAVLGTCLALAAAVEFRPDAGPREAFDRVARLRRELSERKQPASAAKEPVEKKRVRKRASRYLNANTKKYAVDPNGLPETTFSIGESYAGLMPISEDPDETRQLFFWFFPSSNPKASNEIAMWFTGGPGCSSLGGLLSENGPVLWQPGTLAPTLNPYSYSNLTNTVWVEQPVGVGYTTGVPNIKNEEDLSAQYLGFWKNFMKAFKMEGRKVYVVGESYGGFYVPYVANAMLEDGNKDYFDVKGAHMIDPIIGNFLVQQEVPIVPYMNYWQSTMTLNSTFRELINDAHEKCGYKAYLEKVPHCDMLDTVIFAAIDINPCFNFYHTMDTCPHPYSVLGIVNTGDYSPPGAEVYFDRQDVKKALHAPLDKKWYFCSPNDVFNTSGYSNDHSAPPANNGVLANVIEKTNNVLIGVGGLDMLLPINGTLLAIQNMTWNGAQGMTKYPNQPFHVPFHPEYNGGALSGAGHAGKWHTDRGLTFYTVDLAGHEIPEYTPGASYRTMELMLGRIKDLSERSSFTTQHGDFTNDEIIIYLPPEYFPPAES